MNQDTLLIIALMVLVSLSVGAMVYAMFFSSVTNEEQASRRLEAVTDRQKATNERRAAADANTRRKNIQSAYKEFEQRQSDKAKQRNKPTLAVLLQQAGLSWSKQTFFVISGLVGVMAGAGAIFSGQKPLVAGGIAIVSALGLPRWIVSIARKRRMAAFINELPNAVDVIVRGIKSGLPLGDCLRIIAIEAQEPVRSEFRAIIEAQQVGLPVGDACMKLYDRIPVAEANFFGIVISIQQKAGGNLSETLGNLSKVLRERKKMKAKIQAVSQEAKSSAAIIGALPIVVGGLVSVVSPNYMKPLFVTSTGNMLLGISFCMMLMGVLVMRKMINFDF
jgi:tight adherence protein B